ncbi:MAG: DUF5995 family protein [Acidimicrobiia bacterium]
METAIDRMRALSEGWLGLGDRRAIFAQAYETMTANMLNAIESGEFLDGAWVGTLLDRFADYYFLAVEAYDNDDGSCPVVWHDAMTACSADHLHPLQLLFLGINAHINYDLAFAISDVLPDWADLDPERREQRRRDHEGVNRVISHTIDAVQSTVVEPVSPLLGLLDRALGPIDERLFAHLIARWRDDVWTYAVHLLESSPSERSEVSRAIERRALHHADVISI